MTTLKLETETRATSHGQWKRQRDGSWRCGNVKIVNIGSTGLRQDWRIFVRARTVRGRADWRIVSLRQRPWGYGHAGQAKIGAGLIAAHQRGAFR